MARRSNIQKLMDLATNLSKPAQAAIISVMENMAAGNAAEDIGDLENSTRASRRRTRAEKEDAKPARRTSRRSREDEEDDKPARRARRSAKAEADDEPEAKPRRARRVKAEPFDGDIVVDDLFDEMDNFEGEPIDGTIRDLKPLVEEYGVDVKALYEAAEEEAGGKLSSSEKATEIGVILAACQHLEAKIVATLKEDPEAMDDIIEELGLELSERARDKTIAKAIIEAINAEVGEDEGEDDEPEADDEPEEKPRRGRRAKAEAEDEDDDDKPARSSRRSKRRSDDDLSDLDDLDD